MTKSILSDAIERVEITRSQRRQQCSEPHFFYDKVVALLLNSSYRTEALLETLLVLFAKFADKLLTEKGDNET